MYLSKYQELALRTTNTELSPREKLLEGALGIAGEAGEVVDCIKKLVYHGHPASDIVPRLTKELGDLLWYMADIASIEGISLDKVATENLLKLCERYPNGFTPEDSINRKEE